MWNPNELPRNLDLYPLPGKPSPTPTWEDIERLALHWPQAHHAVTLVERGDYTKEQALVLLVYALADAFSRMFKAEVDRRSMEVTPHVVFPLEK